MKNNKVILDHIEQVDIVQMAIKRRQLYQGVEEERKERNGLGAAEDAPEEEVDHSYREA